ncbi:hypothetical protein OSTOST_14250 [Ostertagia ostertagi]
MIPDELNVSLKAEQNCKLNSNGSPNLNGKKKMFKPHVEVQLRKGVAKSQIEGRIPELETFIKEHKNLRNWVPINMELSNDSGGDSNSLSCRAVFAAFIHGIVIGCTNFPDACALSSLLEDVKVDEHNVHFYRLNTDGAMNQALSVDENSDDNAVGSLLWQLPCSEFENLWENLVYDSDLKNESGKLVLKMFDQIDELAEDDRCMVFVLIDEIESLGMSRDASTSRVIRLILFVPRTNVIVLCTSNMEGCLDRALLDRADVVRHVGQPSANALYSILAKCVGELIRIGLVVSDQQLPSIRELKTVESECSPGRELMELATLALGLSGRSIRQVPALAWSKADEDTVTLSTCLSISLENAILGEN